MRHVFKSRFDFLVRRRCLFPSRLVGCSRSSLSFFWGSVVCVFYVRLQTAFGGFFQCLSGGVVHPRNHIIYLSYVSHLMAAN